MRFGSLRRLTPISRAFGFDRGLPIDRYYIERFYLSTRAISGEMCWRLAMIATPAGSEDRVTKSDVLHVSEGNPNATIVADLTCAAHIPSDSCSKRGFQQQMSASKSLGMCWRRLPFCTAWLLRSCGGRNSSTVTPIMRSQLWLERLNPDCENLQA